MNSLSRFNPASMQWYDLGPQVFTGCGRPDQSALVALYESTLLAITHACFVASCPKTAASVGGTQATQISLLQYAASSDPMPVLAISSFVSFPLAGRCRHPGTGAPTPRLRPIPPSAKHKPKRHLLHQPPPPGCASSGEARPHPPPLQGGPLRAKSAP